MAVVGAARISVASSRPRVVVLGEKPQGAQWLRFLLASEQFEIIAGVPRFGGVTWWGDDEFETILREHQIPVIRRAEVKNFDYEILWSLMYGFIIEGDLIEKAHWFGLNLHESPLPRYRGCNGYTHAILEDAVDYGTTFQFLAGDLDAGEIIDQELFDVVPGETAKELYIRTVEYSNRVFLRNMEAVAMRQVSGRMNPVDGEPIRARSSLVALKAIDLATTLDMRTLYRHVRALDFVPFEPAYTDAKGARFYWFVDGSTARTPHPEAEPATVSTPSEAASLLSRGRTFRIGGFIRDLIVMDADVYRENYPCLVPKYSWMASDGN